MYKFRELRDHFRGLTESMGEVPGRQEFVAQLRYSLGLLEQDSAGGYREVRGDNGQRTLHNNGRRRPEEFSLPTLAEAIGGRELLEYYRERATRSDVLLTEAPITPQLQLNVNLFTAAVGGLVEAKVLEAFQNARLVGDQLVTITPTNKNGEKMIGLAGIELAEGDQGRLPGEPHARGLFGDRWIETPELREKALAVEVTQEAVIYDLTGDILRMAASVGETLAYQRELEVLRTVCGVDNTYNYKGTAYNTYQASTPWINSHANPASTYADIDEARELFRNMVDPETGYRILVNPTTLLFDEAAEATWHKILNSTELRITDSNLQTLVPPQPFARSGQYNLVPSVIMRDVLVASGIDAANAKQYWFFGDPKRAFAWMEAWPLRVMQAPQNEQVMMDRGLVAVYFANYRGRAAVLEPRYMTRNTN